MLKKSLMRLLPLAPTDPDSGDTVAQGGLGLVCPGRLTHLHHVQGDFPSESSAREKFLSLLAAHTRYPTTVTKLTRGDFATL